jgi:hypothetical protein
MVDMVDIVDMIDVVDMNICNLKKIELFLQWSKKCKFSAINNILTVSSKIHRIKDIFIQIYKNNYYNFDRGIEILIKIINIPSDFSALEIAINQNNNINVSEDEIISEMIDKFASHPSCSWRPIIICENDEYKLTTNESIKNYNDIYLVCDQCNIRYSDERNIKEFFYVKRPIYGQGKKCINCEKQEQLVKELLKLINHRPLCNNETCHPNYLMKSLLKLFDIDEDEKIYNSNTIHSKKRKLFDSLNSNHAYSKKRKYHGLVYKRIISYKRLAIYPKLYHTYLHKKHIYIPQNTRELRSLIRSIDDETIWKNHHKVKNIFGNKNVANITSCGMTSGAIFNILLEAQGGNINNINEVRSVTQDILNDLLCNKIIRVSMGYCDCCKFQGHAFLIYCFNNKKYAIVQSYIYEYDYKKYFDVVSKEKIIYYLSGFYNMFKDKKLNVSLLEELTHIKIQDCSECYLEGSALTIRYIEIAKKN